MGRTAIGLLVGAFALAGAAQEQGQDARNLIKMAIDAHRETLHGKRLAIYQKMALKNPDGAVDQIEHYQQPGGGMKYDFKSTNQSQTLQMTTIFDGVKGWNKIQFQGQSRVVPIGDEEIKVSRDEEQSSRVSFMVDLLADPAFQLTYLGEDTLAGKKVVGVLVASKGQRDHRLFFDPSTHLLAGMRLLDQKGGKEVEHETVFSDYRELGISAEEKNHLGRAGVAADAAGALALLPKLVLAQPDRKALEELVSKLGDTSFAVREQATEKLKKAGPGAIRLLREAAKRPEAEIAQRAQQCLEKLRSEGADQVAMAAIRLLGYTQPPAAAETILDYLPQAQDDAVLEEAKAVLASLAQLDGKPHPALLKALESSDKIRKDTATAVLGRDGGAYLNKPGRQLFLKNSKYPARQKGYNDGRLDSETETLEIRYFNRLDDAMFAEPK